jgi:glycosyltransferase involved in cell wall biosynthesis
VKICLLSVEIFAWGKYGGFGRATRLIGRELAKRGHEVYAVVPRRLDQKEIEDLDGITVYGFNPYWPFSASKYIKAAQADIYHSCEPSFSTYLATRVMPEKKHIVTFRDPRDTTDWKMEFELPSKSKVQVIFNYIYENNYLVKNCMKHIDGFYSPARCLREKTRSIYDLEQLPEFLPTPVSIPETITKSETPVVCFLSRLDRRKRPEIFLDLVEKFPGVQFIIIGKSRDVKWETYLKDKYSMLSNLEFTGFIDQFSSNRMNEILERSWVMVNTATREGLPNAFIEALSHKCAILSHVDPEKFATDYGYHADSDDFEYGLNYLLEDNRWKQLGENGYAYIKETFEMDESINRHIQIYERLLQ